MLVPAGRNDPVEPGAGQITAIGDGHSGRASELHRGGVAGLQTDLDVALPQPRCSAYPANGGTSARCRAFFPPALKCKGGAAPCGTIPPRSWPGVTRPNCRSSAGTETALRRAP